MFSFARRIAFSLFLSTALTGLLSSGLLADYAPAIAHVGGTDAFTFGTPVTTNVAAGSSYQGIGTQVAGTDTGDSYAPSSALILAGANPGGDTTISMAWRTRTPLESDGPSQGGVYVPSAGFRQFAVPTGGTDGRGLALALDCYALRSDVLSLQGISGPYVLQMQYDPVAQKIADVPDLAAMDTAYCDGQNRIYLAYLETNDTGTNCLPSYDTWVNAVDGNSTTGIDAVAFYKGSFSQFVSEHPDFNLTDYLGSFGSDISTNSVWAVIDHNSEFAVVPEPTTLGLLGGGLAALLLRRRK